MGGGNIKQEDDAAGVAFTKSSRAEYKKTVQCYGCGRKEHYLSKCTKTSVKKKEDILTVVKSGDFKVTKTSVVNTAMDEKGEEPDEPPDDACIEDLMGFR